MLTLRSQLTKSALQAFVYAPLVVPVILLAIGILDVQTKTHLLGTTWGLIFAHTVLALPFTFAITYNALAGLDPAIEEAAWTMGATADAHVLRRRPAADPAEHRARHAPGLHHLVGTRS